MRRNPYAPFTTSTLQQEASRKLGFSAKQTMQVAQRLYEGVELDGEVTGLITYMRTDGVTIIPEAIAAIRKLVESDYSKRYLPPFIREYKTKAKNAQEAHEAIRPTDVAAQARRTSRAIVERDQARLYELIWKRAVASQMASAELEQTTAEIEVPGRDGKAYGLRATGSVVLFDGFLKLYEEGRDDRVRRTARPRKPPRTTTAAACRRWPQGDALKDRGIEAKQHFTEPPPRFTEATLVKRMEELGIGRPSTYASTLAVLQERDYVRIDKKRLIPEDKGRLVTAFLESFFKRYVEYDFTADLEEKLDLISDGKLEWKDVLRDFWRDFMARRRRDQGPARRRGAGGAERDPGPPHLPAQGRGRRSAPVPQLRRGAPEPQGQRQVRRLHRLLATIPTAATRASSPQPDGPAEASTPDGKLLGTDPETGLPVTLRTGRFGPYVQLGEGTKARRSPSGRPSPRASTPTRVELDYALKLLSLPREVGLHPETGKPITAGPRPLRPLHPARRHLRQPADGGGGVRRRHQPRRGAAGGEEGRRRQGPLPARRADRAQGARRAPERRRQGAGAVGPLRPLRQARRRQRHAAAGQGAGRADHGRGRAADRRARGQGSLQAQGPTRQARQEGRGDAPARRQRQGRSPAKPKAKPKGKAKAGGTREAAE